MSRTVLAELLRREKPNDQTPVRGRSTAAAGPSNCPGPSSIHHQLPFSNTSENVALSESTKPPGSVTVKLLSDFAVPL